MGYLLLMVLVILLIVAMPTWPYSRSWGYGPMSLAGFLLVVAVVLLLVGAI